MRISITEVESRTAEPCIAAARAADQAGFDMFWVAGGWRDPVTLALLAGRDVPGLTVGTSIASVWQTAPVALAEQALTVHDALEGRFVLGVGLSHVHMVEQRLGLKFERPIRYLREYLTILMQGLETQQVDFSGELLSAHTALRLPVSGRPKVLVAALGPQALKVTGALADGTSTFMVPLHSLLELTIPIASAAAREAGRPRPYFCASMPVCVTTEIERGRDMAAKTFVNYGSGYYPSYRAALDRAGTGGPQDVAIVGDEETVARHIARYAEAGIDEVIGVLYGTPEDQARSRTCLGQLAKQQRA